MTKLKAIDYAMMIACLSLIGVTIIVGIFGGIGITGYVKAFSESKDLYKNFAALEQNSRMAFNYSNTSKNFYDLNAFETLEEVGMSTENGHIVIEKDGWYGLMARCTIRLNESISYYFEERFGMFFTNGNTSIGKIPYSRFYARDFLSSEAYFEFGNVIMAHKTLSLKKQQKIGLRIVFFQELILQNGTKIVPTFVDELYMELKGCTFSAFSIDVTK